MPSISLPTINIPEEGLKSKETMENILDTLQKYRKELNFLLMNLDLDNMPTIGGLIGDLEGDYSLISQTVDGIILSVGNVAGDVSALQLQADSIIASVADAEGNIAALQLQATSIIASVSSNDGDIAALVITASGIQTQVTNQAGQISTINQTVSGITSTVASLDDDIGDAFSEISQLSTEITSIVSFTDVTGNQIASRINQTATTIKLTANKIELDGITYVNKSLRIGSTTDGGATLVFGGSGANITGSAYGAAGVNINASDTFVNGRLWVNDVEVTGGSGTMKWA